MSNAQRPNRLLLEIPPPLRTRLRALKERTGLAEAEIIRTALAEYLDRRELENPSR